MEKDSNRFGIWQKNSRANMLWSSSGWRRIRTFEGIASRFTVCPLWPLGNPSVNEFIIYKEESFCKIFFQLFWCFARQSVFEKAFPQSARPTLQYILPEFSCRSPLRRLHPDKIFHKLWRTSCRKLFSNTLQVNEKRINNSFFLQRGRRMGKNLLNYRQWK